MSEKALRRYIRPREVLRQRIGDAPWPRWPAAVFCFRDLGGTLGFTQAAGASPMGRRIFSGMDKDPAHAHVYEFEAEGCRIGVAGECGWGGVQAAILVEEAAALGVKVLVGYGAAGGLVPEIPRGGQIVARRALLTDGTSRAYADGDQDADPELLRLAAAAAARLGVPLVPVTVATVDALYRETPELIREYLRLGAQSVNMEGAAFYAASRACGVRSLWLGHISDRLLGETWESWNEGRAEMSEVTARLCLEVVRDAVKAGVAGSPGGGVALK